MAEEPNQNKELSTVELTPGMLAAGAYVLTERYGLVYSGETIAREVFEAMVAAHSASDS